MNNNHQVVVRLQLEQSQLSAAHSPNHRNQHIFPSQQSYLEKITLSLSISLLLCLDSTSPDGWRRETAMCAYCHIEGFTPVRVIIDGICESMPIFALYSKRTSLTINKCR